MSGGAGPAFETAGAKLNLALHVRGRRSDGYHDIETVYLFCADGDRIEIGTSDGLAIAGPFGEGLPNGPDNLVHAAATALRSAFAIVEPWSLRLTKNLPIAAGVGGGSADAAAALRLLCRRWHIDPSGERVKRIAAALGADVPACLASRAAFADGRGDTLHFIDNPFPAAPALLLNPRVPVSTAAVFAAWDGVDRGPLDRRDLASGRNDLETPARALCPAIDDILSFLAARSGVLLSRMSGSGATCFALFGTEAARDEAAAGAPTHWWRLVTRLGE